MAAVGIRNRRVLKLLLNPWFRRSTVKRFVTAGKLHKLIIIIDLLRETKNRSLSLCHRGWPAVRRPFHPLSKCAPNSTLMPLVIISHTMPYKNKANAAVYSTARWPHG